MLQSGRDRDLAQEPVGPDRRRDVGAQHLERDAPVELHITRDEDDGHAAVADLLLDHITVANTGMETLEEIHVLQSSFERRESNLEARSWSPERRVWRLTCGTGGGGPGYDMNSPKYAVAVTTRHTPHAAFG